MENVIQIQYYQSPCGELILGAYREKLCLCDWKIEERRIIIDRRIQKELQASYKEGISEVITRTIGQLDEYFSGRRTTFDIPYGKTISYAGLSQKLGNPKAIRAIASANGANPISILVPCHRVIGSDRKLVGYGGGLPAKKILLDLESSDRLF